MKAAIARGIDFLKALEVYVCVADAGSMTAAARSLGITQSAVSQYVRLLEKDLGQRLFDRSVRPVRLTNAGAALHKLALQLLHDAALVRAQVRAYHAHPASNLRFAVIGSLAGTLIPKFVSVMKSRLSVGKISIWRGMATTAENALTRHDVDFLITSDPLLDIAGLERYELFHEPFVLVTPGDMNGPCRDLEQLARTLPFIRYTKRSRTGWAIETHLRRLRLNLPDDFEFDSSEDILSMVSAGRGWTITALSHILHGMRRSDRINILPLPIAGFRRTILLIVRASEMGSLPIEMAQLCREVVTEDFLPMLHKLAPGLKDRLEVAE